jgi:hypothetical protein
MNNQGVPCLSHLSPNRCRTGCINANQVSHPRLDQPFFPRKPNRRRESGSPDGGSVLLLAPSPAPLPVHPPRPHAAGLTSPPATGVPLCALPCDCPDADPCVGPAAGEFAGSDPDAGPVSRGPAGADPFAHQLRVVLEPDPVPAIQGPDNLPDFLGELPEMRSGALVRGAPLVASVSTPLPKSPAFGSSNARLGSGCNERNI